MKVSISKFYKEVTGSKTANRNVVAPALDRWGVPYRLPNGTKGDAVDVGYLDMARIRYEEEKAGALQRQAAKKKRASPPSQPPGNGKGGAEEQLLPLVVRLDDNVTSLQRKMDALLTHLGAKL